MAPCQGHPWVLCCARVCALRVCDRAVGHIGVLCHNKGGDPPHTDPLGHRGTPQPQWGAPIPCRVLGPRTSCSARSGADHSLRPASVSPTPRMGTAGSPQPPVGHHQVLVGSLSSCPAPGAAVCLAMGWEGAALRGETEARGNKAVSGEGLSPATCHPRQVPRPGEVSPMAQCWELWCSQVLGGLWGASEKGWGGRRTRRRPWPGRLRPGALGSCVAGPGRVKGSRGPRAVSLPTETRHEVIGDELGLGAAGDNGRAVGGRQWGWWDPQPCHPLRWGQPLSPKGASPGEHPSLWQGENVPKVASGCGAVVGSPGGARREGGFQEGPRRGRAGPVLLPGTVPRGPGEGDTAPGRGSWHSREGGARGHPSRTGTQGGSAAGTVARGTSDMAQ